MTQTPRPGPNILDIMADPKLFGPWFKGSSWEIWRVLLRALFALGLDDAERLIFRLNTGRDRPPETPCREAWLICGRRSGKSFIAAVIAVFLACFKDWTPFLNAGEAGVVMLLAADRRQARVLMRYVIGLINSVPMLKALVIRETNELVELSTRINIEIHTASYRSVRGYSIVAAICDEIAFWSVEGTANPDREILAAIRPAMATIPEPLLLGISSPYAQRGELYTAFDRYFGKNDAPVLVWRAPTEVMNPSVPRHVITEAYERDPISASAEFGAQFRTDVEQFVTMEVVRACVISDRFELPYSRELSYSAFCDPSGGSQDSMTLAIGHSEADIRVLDCVREVKPPFNPDQVVQDFAQELTRYGIKVVTGDRYGGQWVSSKFSEYGIKYKAAEKTKSDIYGEFLPLLNAGRVQLLDNKMLIAQLTGLERRTSRLGRDSIDHGPGGHDDIVNSVAGVLTGAGRRVRRVGVWGVDTRTSGSPLHKSWGISGPVTVRDVASGRSVVIGGNKVQ